MEAKQHVNKIAVIGLGLIGASVSAAYKQTIPQGTVYGVDIEARSCEVALEKGWVDWAGSPESPEFRDYILDGCELAIIATPASAAKGYLQMLDGWGYTGVITDTASTKARICEDARQVLERPELFIPGHPMAGSKVNGIDGARPDLFEGAHWILCPDQNTPPELYTRLHELLVEMKARVVTLPREDHDRAVAVISHVPHIVASSLVELASRHADDQQSLFRLAAGGFKDSTRIAAGSP